jgi:hypothetical protein
MKRKKFHNVRDSSGRFKKLTYDGAARLWDVGVIPSGFKVPGDGPISITVGGGVKEQGLTSGYMTPTECPTTFKGFAGYAHTGGYKKADQQEAKEYVEKIKSNQAPYFTFVGEGLFKAKKENFTFFKVLSVLSLLVSTAVAFTTGWEFNILVTRIEWLKWYISHF